MKKMTKTRRVSPIKKKIAPIKRGASTGVDMSKKMHRMGDGTMMSTSAMEKMMGKGMTKKMDK